MAKRSSSVLFARLTSGSSNKRIRSRQANMLKVASWNTDGLDASNLQSRTEEVCSILLEQQPLPDVILLQEVIHETATKYSNRFVRAGYSCFPSQIPEFAPYFTLAFVRTGGALNADVRISVSTSERISFPSSGMGRDLVAIDGTLRIGGGATLPLLFMTSHFESCAPATDIRKLQLKQTLQRLTAFDGLAVFAGDTNLREKEVKAEPLCKQVQDAWVSAGSDPSRKYTWDLLLNHNKQMPQSTRGQPRMRLDRMYYSTPGVEARKENNRQLNCTSNWSWGVNRFELLGTEVMAPPEQCHPSDHFGMCTVFELQYHGEDPDSSGAGAAAGAGEKLQNGQQQPLSAPPVAQSSDWACHVCTFINSNPSGLACEMCSTERQQQPPQNQVPLQPAAAATDTAAKDTVAKDTAATDTAAIDTAATDTAATDVAAPHSSSSNNSDSTNSTSSNSASSSKGGPFDICHVLSQHADRLGAVRAARLRRFGSGST